MTSMLLRLSMCRSPGRLLRLLDGLGHHLGIGLEPVRDPRPLAAPHLQNLHQASPLLARGVASGGRTQPPQGKPFILSNSLLTSSPGVFPVGRALQAVPIGLPVAPAMEASP